MHLGRVHARRAQQARHAHVRRAVLVRGRGVHGDEAAAVVERGAEIAAEARVFGGGGEGKARGAIVRRQPALQGGAPSIAVYH